MKNRWLGILVIAACSLLVQSSLAYEKNNPGVMKAFRPIVEQTQSSTVRVYSDRKRASLGTVVDKDGYIFTKASELKGELECQDITGQRAPAVLVGVDRKLDLAMLKADLKGLKPVQWTTEQDTQLGSWLVSVGLDKEYPLGIGVVSATTRPIPRSSGALGVELQEAAKGGGVRRVMPNSAAEKAGLQAGDVVTSVGEKAIKNWLELREEIFTYEPGDEIQLEVLRNNETLKLTVVLGSFQQILQGERAEFQNALGGPLSQRRAGFAKVIQHDTVLKPHDCGGPVLNLDGKALGINIARAGRVETYALTSSIIEPLIEEFKSGKFAVQVKKVQTPVAPEPAAVNK